MPVEGGSPLRSYPAWAPAGRTLEAAALGILLLGIAWWWIALAIQDSPSDWAFDFRQFWQGGHDVVHGVSPYPTSAHLDAAGDELGPRGIQEVFRFPYPAGAAVALAPFGAIAFQAAAALWAALLIVSLLAALWLLEVRDPRVLAVVATSAPVISSVRLGTLTPLLVLLVAAVWRWRDRRWISGGALALAMSLKLFPWPLVVWLAATRRWAAALIAVGAATTYTLVAWAAIGFAGLGVYPDLIRRLADVVADRGYSLVALGATAGLPAAVSEALPWVVGLALLVGTVVSARTRSSDRWSFALALVAALAFTPIVWLHYFVLLVVPLALARPRFAWIWFVLWAFWLTPVQETNGEVGRVLLGAAATAGVLVAVHRAKTRQRTELA